MLHRHRRPSPHRCLRAVAIGLIVALAAVWGPGRASADGDPASDVLVYDNVFLPTELGYSRPYELLNALLTESARAGFPIRVALIDAPDDLGTVSSLWLNPKAYSSYLEYELSLAFKGQVAVVMPNGIYVNPGAIVPTAAERRVAATLAAPGSGAAMVSAAVAAVERLAAAEGHPLPTAGIRLARPVASQRGDATEALALALGAVLIAIAWGASLRARPLRLGRRAVS